MTSSRDLASGGSANCMAQPVQEADLREAGAVQPEDSCPYKGLDPYTEQDRAYFFGREEDQQTIGANLLTARLTILYGASGVGKSSVLQAGVAPFLRGRPNVKVVLFREWQHPDSISALKAAVASACGERLEAVSSASLSELLVNAARATYSTIAVILDQFEDYFLYHPPAADGGFDAELATAVNRQDVPAGFLLSIREDALSLLDRFDKRIPNLLGNYLRLEHLDREAAERAIREPLKRYKGGIVTIEDQLVNDLISQVKTGQVRFGQTGQGQTNDAEGGSESGDFRIETPFLQMVLERLWKEDAPAGGAGRRHSQGAGRRRRDCAQASPRCNGRAAHRGGARSLCPVLRPAGNAFRKQDRSHRLGFNRLRCRVPRICSRRFKKAGRRPHPAECGAAARASRRDALRNLSRCPGRAGSGLASGPRTGARAAPDRRAKEDRPPFSQPGLGSGGGLADGGRRDCVCVAAEQALLHARTGGGGYQQPGDGPRAQHSAGTPGAGQRTLAGSRGSLASGRAGFPNPARTQGPQG